jgi:hypothetical protein
MTVAIAAASRMRPHAIGGAYESRRRWRRRYGPARLRAVARDGGARGDRVRCDPRCGMIEKVAWLIRRAVERMLEQAKGAPLLPLEFKAS